MKKLLAAILAIIVIIAFAGCEKLPEEPEPTRTPSSSTPEPKDYYSDSDEEASDPEDTDSTEGEEGEEGEEEVETSEEEDDSEEEEPTFRYTRRTREEIEAELNQGIEKDEDGARVGQDLTGRYRIIPPAGGWTGARGGVVKKETPAATAMPGTEAPVVKPTPTETPKPDMTVWLNAKGSDKQECKEKAYIFNNEIPMIDLKFIVDKLGGHVSYNGLQSTVSLNGQIIYIDLTSGSYHYPGGNNNLYVMPQRVESQWYVPLDFFSAFIGAELYFSNNDVVINIPPKASKS